ncbi:MAG: NADH-quinone oxidoreductase subunit L [Cyclobacteriaceae bacterium]|nr:NADH-quinone oxidoreductase subunit L [Cyclobacteriaceae bacterium]MDH4295889.1 NADH-quinone oxidoreductase subunit L [Cyclobacteriaceae bacterium]MDH5248538.1 NADH-quinone oxidoreductase subunit L [Cyclobacteriaceae bacterium]
MDFSYTILILLLPVALFFIIGLLGSKMNPKVSGMIGTSGLFIITLLSYVTAFNYFTHRTGEVFQSIEVFQFVWLPFTDRLVIHLGILLDPLSVMMLVVITTVSLMVHIYSLGYMKGEVGFARYYAFLSFFTFSMLGLVVATNIFQMYIFWELVGVSSYLLIGFYYERPSAVAAAKKAFIVTRFADLGFLIGILLLSFYTNTFDFIALTDLNGPAIAQSSGVVFLGMSVTTWAMLLIFMGGAGKSAMFPLHIWLPDAMEGPTPVSALIHAATMVVAGVYLVARLFPIYHFSAPGALEVIAYIGSFTSLFAAVIACTQLDIKRVLAYSTLSQIGYMMVALGVSGYGSEAGLGYMASLFHLFTHAFFKALLFLGAGSVIHAVHSNLMTEMGGLRKHMPITHITFLVACLTISGIPPLSGFFSKDEILVAAFEHHKLIFAVQWIVAGITAFYMFRLYFTIFWNSNPQYNHVPHESPPTMTIPLVILALASVFSGFVPFHDLVTSDGRALITEFHWIVAIPSVLVGMVGISFAAVLYYKKNSKPETVAKGLKAFYTMAYQKFYIDEVYLFVTHKVIFQFISRPIAWFDRHIVDGAMNLIGNTTVFFSGSIKKMQSGQMQEYIWYFTSGVLLLTLLIFYLN